MLLFITYLFIHKNTVLLLNEPDAHSEIILENAIDNNQKKLSLFLGKVLQQFARLVHEPLLLNKGQYYKLIKFLPKSAIDTEVSKKLDLLVKYLDFNGEW